MKVTDLEGWQAGLDKGGNREGGTGGKMGSNKGLKPLVESISSITADRITSAEWNFSVGRGSKLFERLSKVQTKLRDIAYRIYQGPITSADSVFLFKEFRIKTKNIIEVFSKELNRWVKIESSILKNVVRSGDINRYWANPTALVLFPYEVKNNSARLFSQSEMEKHFPLAWEYLNKNKKILEDREKNSFRDAQWYRFGRTQNLGLWEQPKLMIPYMVTNLSAFLDEDKNYYFINVTTGGYGITINEKLGSYSYICGLLNSRLLNFYFKRVSTNFHGGYFAANKQYIEQLPIRTIDASNPKDKAQHNLMVKLVESIQGLQKLKAAAKTQTDQDMIQRQIDATDREIDTLVYELYDLTKEEIAIVEGETRND